jgi:hypothetical protein
MDMNTSFNEASGLKMPLLIQFFKDREGSHM